jgi:hypothetical protein
MPHFDKAEAEAEVRRLTGRRTHDADEINTFVQAMSGIAAILRNADPADKREVYRQLGSTLTYEPSPAESRRRPDQMDHVPKCVGGLTRTIAPRLTILTADLLLA